MGNEISERSETVREYNSGEHCAKLARILAKITGRGASGRVEIDASQGSPAVVKTPEVVKDK